MPLVHAKPDTLNDVNDQFQHQKLTTPVFLNSVPKCGTHLIKNIFRMFVAVEQQYHDAFIQIPILHQHKRAFDPRQPKLSWGHLLFSDDSAIVTKQVKQIVVVRDPYDWVLARARFFISDTFQGSLDHLKNNNVSIEQLMNMMIFGIYQKAPMMSEIFTHNAVAWLGTGVKLVRYEDLVYHANHLDKGAAQDYFEDLLSVCGYQQLPADWKERVKLGADRKQSGTARENLAGQQIELPKTLPEAQRKLVDYAVPGLRQLLGYQ